MPPSETPVEVVAEDTSVVSAPPDASSTEAELNAKIDAELGLPAQEAVVEVVEEEAVPDEVQEDESDSEEVVPDEAGKTEEEVKPETTPSDEELFIEVEDSEGVTHKITSIDDLPEDFSPKNNRQILEIIKATDRIESQLEQRASDKATEAENQLTREATDAQFDSWDKEVEALAGEKRLDVTDTERLDAVFGYMREINEARAAAGNPNIITSVEDALDKLEVKEAKDAAEMAKVNDNERAKAKSAMIGRSSATSAGDNFVYRSGQYRSIDDIPLS